MSDSITAEGSQIDIWRFCLNCEASVVRGLFQRLSLDEKQRANGFRFTKDRDHYIVARGNLRKIIGVYLDLEAEKIRFSYNKYGKPFLDHENDQLRFNVSHSRGVALIAVSLGREVGIDIEFIDGHLDIFTVSKSIFSPVEIRSLENFPAELRAKAFFRGWTRKEAYLKALGKGFSEDPEQVPFSVMTDDSRISFRTNGGRGFREWSLMSLDQKSEYAAAVAVEGDIGTLRYRSLTEN